MTNKMQKAAAKNQSGRETVVNSAEIDDMSEKDATEVELERILFGDDDGFFKGLRSYEDIGNLGDSSLWNALGDTDDDEDGQKVALEGVRDADVRLVDLLPSWFDPGLLIREVAVFCGHPTIFNPADHSI